LQYIGSLGRLYGNFQPGEKLGGNREERDGNRKYK
jgi:hypothetical protein